MADLDQDLLAAIRVRDATAAGDLLTKGADPNAKDQSGRTALMHATLQGDAETMQALIAAGADVNSTASMGESALTLAAISFSDRTVPILIAHKGDVSARDNKGKSVLMWAVDPQFHRQGTASPEVVDQLVKAGCDPNVADDSGKPALVWALTGLTGEGDLNVAVIEALLDGGADVDARNNRGMTPLMTLIEGSARTLSPGGRAEAVAELLIDKGADVNAADKSGKTVLQWAKGREKLRRLLKKAGAKK